MNCLSVNVVAWTYPRLVTNIFNKDNWCRNMKQMTHCHFVQPLCVAGLHGLMIEFGVGSPARNHTARTLMHWAWTQTGHCPYIMDMVMAKGICTELTGTIELVPRCNTRSIILQRTLPIALTLWINLSDSCRETSMGNKCGIADNILPTYTHTSFFYSCTNIGVYTFLSVKKKKHWIICINKSVMQEVRQDDE